MKLRARSSLLLLVFCLYTGAAWPETQEIGLNTSIRLLAQDIQDRLGEKPNGRLAVVPFRMNAGTANALESFVADGLMAALVNGGKVTVVERRLLSDVISEIRNSESGLIDQATAKKAKLQGADYILTGTITVLSNYVTVNARIIDTETGRVSASAQRNLLRDEDVKKLLETSAVEPVPEPQERGETLPTQPSAGTDLQRLQKENRELAQQVVQLQKEDHDRKAKVEQMEGQLKAAQKELSAAQKELARLKLKPVKGPTGQSPPEVPEPARTDEQARRAAEEALGKIEVTSTGYAADENGAFQTWKGLYAQGGELAIRSLLSLLADPKRDWQAQWKIITLLTYASRTPEGQERTSEIIAAAANLMFRVPFVNTAALELIAGAPVPPRVKWEALFPILQQASPDKADALVRRMPELTPAGERGRTAKAIADILSYTNQSTSISAAIYALEALNARAELPRFRAALGEVPVEKANGLAELLAYFGDRDSAPQIRKAIETWQHGAKSIRPLVLSLKTLEGSACYAYLAEVLADSHPQIQREILYEVMWNDDPALLETIRRLAESTTDSEVKRLAEQYLARKAPPAAAPPPSGNLSVHVLTPGSSRSPAFGLLQLLSERIERMEALNLARVSDQRFREPA